jgi:CBS domain containing-hemolysin-like protein
MVFLVDEYGGVEGIVTLRDVFRELLGETARASPTRAADSAAAGGGDDAIVATDARDGDLVVRGDEHVHDLAQRLGRPTWAARTPAVTVGGLVIAALQRIPEPGERVEVDGVQLRVLEGDRRSVKRVAVRANPG